MHDFKDELWIRFLNLDFIQFVVKNDDSQIFVLPNNNKNCVIFFWRGGGQRKTLGRTTLNYRIHVLKSKMWVDHQQFYDSL